MKQRSTQRCSFSLNEGAAINRWRLCLVYWEKLNRGVSKPGGFPLFSGKVQIVSWTLSGLFLVGALNRPRKRKRTNRENPRTIPEQIGKIPEKSGKSQKGQKRKDKSRLGNPPRLKHPRLAALESSYNLISCACGRSFSLFWCFVLAILTNN